MFLSVITIQSLFTRMGVRQSSAAIVISTPVIAALFNPIRRRVQDFINRGFYRRKYNAEHTLTAFSKTVRDQAEIATPDIKRRARNDSSDQRRDR
jgi:hypothetical protein